MVSLLRAGNKTAITCQTDASKMQTGNEGVLGVYRLTEYGADVDLCTALEQCMCDAIIDNGYLDGPKRRIERGKADQSNADICRSSRYPEDSVQ
jgi:hypothetical protein